MGTSCAVIFANLYFGYHEKHAILPRFQENLKRIPFYRRFIDDVFFVWTGACDHHWEELVSLFNNFGILKWDITQPSASVDFLDLTITIREGRCVTRTYQKPDNPYLYIPPHSAHPSGMIHGIIYGLLRTYHRQNSDYSDFVHFSQLLFQRHLLQGWDSAFLKKVFFSALQKITTKRNIPNAAPVAAITSDDNKKQAFFHMEFHPGDIPRRDVRKIYTDTCEEIFKDRLDIEKFTITYS